MDTPHEELVGQGWKAGEELIAERLAVGPIPVSEAVARGVEFCRARVVSEPVSDCIRYEHSCTFQNIAAGEAVRWLPRRLASDLLLPGHPARGVPGLTPPDSCHVARYP